MTGFPLDAQLQPAQAQGENVLTTNFDNTKAYVGLDRGETAKIHSEVKQRILRRLS